MQQAMISTSGRFKTKLTSRKLEWKKFDVEQFSEPRYPNLYTGSGSELVESWVDSVEYGVDEGSTTTTTSNYGSQCFDSVSSEEVFLQEQVPSLAQFQTLSSESSMRPMQPSSFQQEWEMLRQARGCSDDVMDVQGPQFVDSSQVMYGRQLPATPWMDHVNHESADVPPLSNMTSEYVEENADEYASTMSVWRLDEQMSLQINTTGMSRHVNMSDVMSVETGAESVDIRDTRDSPATPDVRPEHRLEWIRQFLEIGVDEAVAGLGQSSDITGRGWRVMVRIVCACRKLSRELRTKRLQKTTPGVVTVRNRSRIFSKARSQIYKGVRRRNGKWVSEVRVGQTSEKVWLGSFNSEKEAALAFDAGRYHCSAKRCRDFNFSGFLKLLGPQMNLRDLSPNDRRRTIQRLAEDHAKNYALLEM
ncbi:hypothetical protein KC19_7G153900 [Ceratodon purpureus]|uniref:AP2/ERF domain-containing protein n=1 Tax=Ceratodon purpureus TaxID=3225 RepID=A0A8T0HBZ5_CERPU|nr:hypothetical protein KC19_7G153900 [Ceratodon purpureus]